MRTETIYPRKKKTVLCIYIRNVSFEGNILKDIATETMCNKTSPFYHQKILQK